MTSPNMNRRRFAASLLAGLVGAPLAYTLARPAHAAERIVIIGGGPAGAAAALVLRQAGQRDVTLIERDPTRLTKSVIVSPWEQPTGPIGYAELAEAGVDLMIDEAADIDWRASRIDLLSGRRMAFDRIILAPGTAARDEAIPGLDARARYLWPAAWGSAQEAARLGAQLAAMPEKGHIVLRLPAKISHPQAVIARLAALASARPDARLTVLDAHPDASIRRTAYAQLDATAPKVEWLRPGNGGIIRAIDPDSGRIETDAGQLFASVVNFLLPRNAGPLAVNTGLTDASGWCPARHNGQSSLQAGATILGDAKSGATRTIKSALRAAHVSHLSEAIGSV